MYLNKDVRAIVSAHSHCASKFERYVMHERAMMTIASALPEFNDLGR